MIPLKIALHGLIALVPANDPGGVNHMTALLVDGRMQHEECISEHHPQLKFLAAKTSECLAADCVSIGNQCVCGEKALAGKEIRVLIPPTPPVVAQALSNASPVDLVPADRIAAASFSYVANFSQMPFNLTLNPGYISGPPSQGLLARMYFDFATMTACSLSKRDDGGEANIHAMSFRRLHDPSQRSDFSQALAQKVIAEIMVPDDSGGQHVAIQIADSGGANSHEITLRSRPDAYRIDVSNQPATALNRDDPCNDGIARHFSMFYALAQDPPLPSERLLPHLRPTQFKNATDMDPVVCLDPYFGLLDRPICPMVTFNP